jgi:hypothetical protein
MARRAVARYRNASKPVPVKSHFGSKEPIIDVTQNVAGCTLSTSCDSTLWVPIQEDGGIY